MHGIVKQSDLNEQMVSARKALGKLLQKIKSLTKKDDLARQRVRLVIYVDEAHELGSITSNDVTRLHVLSRCFDRLNEFEDKSLYFVGIYLSTNSKMGMLAPAAAWFASARARSPQANLQAPITEVPFDCHPDKVKPNSLTCADVETLEFIARFGRPL